MGAYVQQALQVSPEEADRLRRLYWLRYGATLLGLVKHHGVKPAHFLHETHLLPGLEARVSGHRHDLASLRRLKGRKVILTNAPRAYALRVLSALRIERCFDAIVTIEDMAMFRQLRPKPDARMLRAVAARLRVAPSRCVLVEDTLQHQKAACRVGMRTVWMQRFGRRGPAPKQRPVRWTRRPGYVDLTVTRLADLLRPGRHRKGG
jgi:putative hydrolase of the HAD superfamily